MGVIHEGLRFDQPQTVFYLEGVDLIEGMAARVRIAPRGWLSACGLPRVGDVITQALGCGCRDETRVTRFPVDLDATLMMDERAVLLEGIPFKQWPDGLYEAQVVLLYQGSEMPVQELVLFDIGEVC
ncbi:hypothetical protein [Thiothrix winogradskyi]|uniref:Uncharacterized protein n=1 Tax=Thiothrix winogradskyi TaxID=96472 RepID=A0ABY3T614_9GAMM|nr:hypothetical protein [Thiothrix winogradskyi]UJS26285.1 hypothetical protein L2Y54_09660 [Thiothrix winogradskyi]